MNDARIEINGSVLEYSIKQAARPLLTVVFIHGFPFDRTIWNRQLEALPEKVRGIAYDVRGNGGSASGHGYFNIDLFANDLVWFIKGLNLKRVVVCGISMGGYIILRAMQLEPELIAGMILCDTTSASDTNESKLNRFSAIEKLQKGEKKDYAANSVVKLFAGHTLENKPDIAEGIRKNIMEHSEASICATLLALASRTDTTDMLHTIHIPALIIRGEEDQLISGKHAEDLRNNISNSQLVTIPSAGHLPNLENPDKFNGAMNDFLRNNFLA